MTSSFYMLQRLRDGRPGHPTFLSYAYDKASGGDNERSSPYVIFYTSYQRRPLVFRCKHRRLDFDFYDLAAGEFLVSSRLLDAARALHLPPHSTIPVRLLSTQGKEITRREYHVLRIRDTLDAVDSARSIIETSPRYDYLKITRHLAIKPDAVADHDLFRITDMTLEGCLFCSDRFRTAALDAGAELSFVPESEAAEAYAAINPLAE